MSGETLLNGRYRLVSQQGSGGMAVIYKAVDEALGRMVAIKVLRPSLTADPTFIARFQNEARSIANLSHPNIVTVHDVGSDGPTHYIVMELVEGQDLKKIIRSHGALSVDRALKLAIGICAGAGYAHRAGIVHADIKPQNMLVTRQNDVVKITDFGIAQALSDTQPVQRQSVVWGSPHYFAPEQAQGEKPTAASDVYSIGIVMFEMLTGRLPFSGANQQELAMAHIRESVPKAISFNPHVPEQLSEIVFQAMQKNPAERFTAADDLGHELIKYRDRGRERTMSSPAVERPSTPLATPPAPASQRPSTPPDSSHPVEPRPQTPPYPQRPAHIPAAPRQQTPPPPAGLPTQRYNPAPEAPAPVNYGASRSGTGGRPSVPSPGGMGNQQSMYDSRPYTPQRGYTQGVPVEAYDEDEGFRLDGVTIVLGILALLSVACLIPLWIAVIQARLG